jgi:MFS family permease
MSTTIQSTPAATARPDRPDPRRWKALAVLGLIQFMLVLDITVVNVALPHIQHDLSFSRAGLAWVVNGYVLMSGGFLLLGGRMADILGRRRVFLLGVGLFAAASASCGAAVDPAMLVASRFVQGLGEALAGLGGTSGTVISGALTGLASWRWIFLINLPVALIALIAVPRLVSEGRMVRAHNRPGVAGAVAGTAGLIAIVDGLLAAASHPWGSWQVLVPLLGGVGLAGLMVWIEARSRAPLIPLSFFCNRTRAWSPTS